MDGLAVAINLLIATRVFNVHTFNNIYACILVVLHDAALKLISILFVRMI